MVIGVEKLGNGIVEFINTEEGTVTQFPQDPSLYSFDTCFYLSFILWSVGACRQDGYPIVSSHIGIALIEDDLLSGMGNDSSLEVVGDKLVGHTAVEGESLVVAFDEGFGALAYCCVYEGVARSAKNTHEDLSFTHFSTYRIDDRHRQTAEVHEELVTCIVDLSHRRIEASFVAVVVLFELGIAVSVGMALLILFPQQQAGHPFLGEFGMDIVPVGMGFVGS